MFETWSWLCAPVTADTALAAQAWCPGLVCSSSRLPLMVTGLVWLCLCHVPLSRLLLTACFSCRIACCTAYMPILSPRAVADAAAVVVSSPLTAGWLSSFTVGSDQQLVCAAGSPALLYTCCCRRQARSCVLSLHSLTAAANSQQQPLHDAGCPAALHTMQLVCGDCPQVLRHM